MRLSVEQADEATAKAQVSHKRPKSGLDVLQGQHRIQKDEGRENSGFNIMVSNLEKITTTYLRKLLGNLAANTSHITDLSRGLPIILNSFFFFRHLNVTKTVFRR